MKRVPSPIKRYFFRAYAIHILHKCFLLATIRGRRKAASPYRRTTETEKKAVLHRDSSQAKSLSILADRFNKRNYCKRAKPIEKNISYVHSFFPPLLKNFSLNCGTKSGVSFFTAAIAFFNMSSFVE